jgi:Ni,Fe-hydrogenase maturation factor
LNSCDLAIFVDASLEGDEVKIREIFPEPKPSFLSHHILPEQFLFWLEELYGKKPRAFLVSIRGWDFDFGEGLSPGGERSLKKGVQAIEGIIKEALERKEINERPQD